MEVEIILGDPQVPIEKTEQLLLHEVDLRQAEAEAVVAANGSIPSPVLVLRRRIVQVLRCQDERGEEDAMSRALHAFGDWR